MNNNNDLIEKVMKSNDFTIDEKVQIINALTFKEKEYVYVPYEKQNPPYTPTPYPSSPYNPTLPTYPIVTCSTSTYEVNDSTDIQKRLHSRKRH